MGLIPRNSSSGAGTRRNRTVLFGTALVFALALDAFAANSPATENLFAAVSKNDIRAAQAAVAAGADVLAKDVRGRTPAEVAIDKGYFDIAHFLLSARNTDAPAPAKAAPKPAPAPPKPTVTRIRKAAPEAPAAPKPKAEPESDIAAEPTLDESADPLAELPAEADTGNPFAPDAVPPEAEHPEIVDEPAPEPPEVPQPAALPTPPPPKPTPVPQTAVAPAPPTPPAVPESASTTPPPPPPPSGAATTPPQSVAPGTASTQTGPGKETFLGRVGDWLGVKEGAEPVGGATPPPPPPGSTASPPPPAPPTEAPLAATAPATTPSNALDAVFAPNAVAPGSDHPPIQSAPEPPMPPSDATAEATKPAASETVPDMPEMDEGPEMAEAPAAPTAEQPATAKAPQPAAPQTAPDTLPSYVDTGPETVSRPPANPVDATPESAVAEPLASATETPRNAIPEAVVPESTATLPGEPITEKVDRVVDNYLGGWFFRRIGQTLGLVEKDPTPKRQSPPPDEAPVQIADAAPQAKDTAETGDGAPDPAIGLEEGEDFLGQRSPKAAAVETLPGDATETAETAPEGTEAAEGPPTDQDTGPAPDQTRIAAAKMPSDPFAPSAVVPGAEHPVVGAPAAKKPQDAKLASDPLDAIFNPARADKAPAGQTAETPTEGEGAGLDAIFGQPDAAETTKPAEVAEAPGKAETPSLDSLFGTPTPTGRAPAKKAKETTVDQIFDSAETGKPESKAPSADDIFGAPPQESKTPSADDIFGTPPTPPSNSKPRQDDAGGFFNGGVNEFLAENPAPEKTMSDGGFFAGNGGGGEQVASLPEEPPPPPEDGALTLGTTIRLAREIPAPPDDPRQANFCVKKRAGAVVFCVEPVDWPEGLAKKLAISTIMYAGAKSIVRYDNGKATRYQVDFPTEAFDALTQYYEKRYGAPDESTERMIAPFAEARKPSQVKIWRRPNHETGETEILEIRQFDDARGGFPDMRHGVVLFHTPSSPQIFPLLSALDLMPPSRRNYGYGG